MASALVGYSNKKRAGMLSTQISLLDLVELDTDYSAAELA